MSYSNSRDNVLINTDKRIFYIQDGIDNETISKINYWLLWLLEEDETKEQSQKNYERKPIKLYINSNGGYVQDMWSLVDIILNSKTQIDTYCTGYAHSCGLFIFLSGKNRYITKHTLMMYHQISNYLNGTYQKIKESFDNLSISQKQAEEYMIERTNFTQDKLTEIREKKLDYMMFCDELLELGVATGIIENF